MEKRHSVCVDLQSDLLKPATPAKLRSINLNLVNFAPLTFIQILVIQSVESSATSQG